MLSEAVQTRREHSLGAHRDRQASAAVVAGTSRWMAQAYLSARRDPQSPWQRGGNENANGLLRQYLPKGIDILSYSQAKLNAVARQLNERPRKTLGFQTPAEMFSQTVALTS
jgi:IS30 family transposase